VSTAREIREFVSPFLTRHPELQLQKRRLFRLPVRHCLVGISFDAPHYRGDVIPSWYVTYLFAPPPRSAGGFGGRIDGAWGVLGDSGLQDRVFGQMERVLAEIIPEETSLDTALEVHKHVPQYFGEMRAESRALLYAALGRFEEAGIELQAELAQQKLMIERILTSRRALKPETSMLEFHEEWQSKITSLDQLLNRLVWEDAAAIARLLHEWEALAVKKRGIERYWEPSPFPFELA
jgi:hypothetical protein